MKHGDDEIIRRVLNGDKHAFRQIVDQYSDMVFTIIIRILNNRELARELSQDVFVKVYQSLSGFNGKSKLSTWIYKIAYNSALNEKRKNTKLALSSLEDHELHLNDNKNAEKAMINDLAKNEINRAIMKLHEDERIIVTLYYFEDISVAEISKVVDLSISNIKVKLHRIRMKLFELLKNRINVEDMVYE